MRRPSRWTAAGRLPACALVIAGPADRAFSIADEVFRRQRWRRIAQPDPCSAVYEAGSALGEFFLDGWLLPLGKIAKHGFATVEVDEHPAEVLTTLALPNGFSLATDLLDVAAEVESRCAALGLLRETRDPISAYDLPPGSIGFPPTFTALPR